jgi:cysteine desulfurase family protein (TIGR01976 family)
MSQFPIDAVRNQFPALSREIDGRPVVYFDGPAGSQVPLSVADAVRDYLLKHNANSHGVFATSRETDAVLESAGRAMADLLGADDPRSITFGPNMTTLTFALSRALAQSWATGDEVLVTRLDHDANVTPWVLAARDAGATVRQAEIRPEDCTLDIDDLLSKLNDKTRLVAIGAASNSSGSINPVRRVVEAAHALGAEVFVDAVHYAPHALVDVAQWGCDYLACSAYKFFGPHMGVLWGRPERLEQIAAYKLRPSPNSLPDKWMTGTQSFEGLAGVVAAVDYLASLGAADASSASRRASLAAAYREIGAYEQELTTSLLDGLAGLSVKVHGVTDPARFDQRLPTVSITHCGRTPTEVAEHLAARGIFVWHGNYYALALTEALDLEPDGMVRIGLLHYNTADEVARLLAALKELE